MSRRSLVRRYAGWAGAAVGVVSAGAAAGVVAERTIVSPRRKPSDQPFGSLRGSQHTVRADDGVEIFAEVDDLTPPRGQGATLVFVHGYALNLDSWHFQRAALRQEHRLVLYDQRSHGRSGRSPSDHCTIDQLGRDLASVLDQLVGSGPVVLVGHSMGGMTIMALAEQRPDWFGRRVAAVALIATSAGGLGDEMLGLPRLPGRLLHRVTPAVVATLARAPRLVDHSRRAGSDIGFMVTRKLAFGGPVPAEYVDFTDEMLASTPFEVVADFFTDVDLHDKREALAALALTPAVVVCGTDDSITPVKHTQEMAAALPVAELVTLEGAGHMVILERHPEVTAAIARLASNAASAGS